MMNAVMEPVETAAEAIATSAQNELADAATLKKVRRVIELGVLPMLKIRDMEGMTMDYAKGILWLAGEEIAENTLINPKQRGRLRKLMAKGFIENMSEADLSALSSHEAEVMIKRGSSGRFRNITVPECDDKIAWREERK